MPWTTPRTWTPGELVTALMMNQHVRDNLNDLDLRSLTLVCDGRLTATSVTPVPTADVSAATSIYFTPYAGNRIALYDGSRWNIRTFSEITISLAGKTASLPYDVFAYDNSGAAAIELLAWTNATTRATALTKQDGVYVKTGSTTRRYIGTVYINSTGGQTDDTALKRYVWNYYHRMRRPLLRQESAGSWTYSLTTIRQANGNTANQVDVMVGVAEVGLSLDLRAMFADNAGDAHVVGIGEDSTTTIATASGAGGVITNGSVSILFAMTFGLFKMPAAGRHFYTWLEASASAGATTWFGTENQFAGVVKSGLYGWIEG
jgi:hypothetical protein